MAKHNHENGPCTPCKVRIAITDLFDARASDGEIGEWIDGIINAAAHIAAAHVLPGHEAEEQAALAQQASGAFDVFFKLQAQREAAGAVKQ